ncbi:hypothetical protein B2J93_3436 [Marssonina coronariae]|uniref:DUF6594 domain-containing protein n=1 Tax=Diplocarpon coronariae TaxID=2795749 RepID=A0A218Z6N0_9HELO|nr:hypothetical protein B2J93_3436 [Marssonina coronariae]
MTTKYTTPSVEPIPEELSEDEAMGGLNAEGTADKRRRSKAEYATDIGASTSRETDRSWRRHKPGSKHAYKGTGKTVGAKKAGGSSRDGHGEPRKQHRRRHSNRSSSSVSSDEEESVEDHRAVLAARARLTSPSLVSTFTTQTAATKKSSSSSGSNSTVTQASVPKRFNLGKKPEGEPADGAPTSPAVSHPPHVFRCLTVGEPTEAAKDVEGAEEDPREEEESQRPPQEIEGESLEPALEPDHATASSTASSRFRGSENSPEFAVDNDTDRSSSPERSQHGHNTNGTPPPADQASAKRASQVAAARRRQPIHGSVPPFRAPSTKPLWCRPPSAEGGQHPPHVPRRLPRAGTLPVTGYELLASKLSSAATSNDVAAGIKPMYRKFAALNHRLLLHLQDELGELEEQLHHLDHADTQTRVADAHGHIVPASRRLAAQAGGELEWRKTDVLGRIGYKLAQYNQALASFERTQSLVQPAIADVENYRAYLHEEQPVVEAETRFLDPVDDLVSICLEPRSPSGPSASSPSSASSPTSSAPPPATIPPRHPSHLPDRVPMLSPPAHPLLPLTSALAISLLLPLLMFTVIPGFVGRMTVAALVAAFLLAALVETGSLGAGSALELGRGKEGLWCVGAWAGTLAVLAGVV